VIHNNNLITNIKRELYEKKMPKLWKQKLRAYFRRVGLPRMRIPHAKKEESKGKL